MNRSVRHDENASALAERLSSTRPRFSSHCCDRELLA